MKTRIDSRDFTSTRFQPREKAIQNWSGWGWGVFFGQLIIAFGFLIFGLTHFAFATPQVGSSENFLRGFNTSVKTEIQGVLNWKNGVGMIRESGTGRIYRLKDSGGLESLWKSGVRKVAAEGRLNPDRTFTVEKVSAE